MKKKIVSFLFISFLSLGIVYAQDDWKEIDYYEAEKEIYGNYSIPDKYYRYIDPTEVKDLADIMKRFPNVNLFLGAPIIVIFYDSIDICITYYFEDELSTIFIYRKINSEIQLRNNLNIIEAFINGGFDEKEKSFLRYAIQPSTRKKY
jgi:hypothetical protein